MNQRLDTRGGIVTIKSVVPDDAALVRGLRLEALIKHPEAFASDGATSAAESIQDWNDRICGYASADNAAIYVASAENQLVGMTGIYCGDRAKTKHNGNIWGVYVRAEWRGLHIAEALIENCVNWGRTHGLVAVKLGVVTTNAPAIRCYTRCGFAVYGIDPKVIYWNGIFYDELLMAKPC